MHLIRTTPDLDRATAIAASGFVQTLSPSLRQDVFEHLAGGDLVYELHADDRMVGFAIFNVWEPEGEILYLSGIIVDEAYQRRTNLQTVLQRACLDAPGSRYLALRTQSVRMWLAASRLCEPWFPRAQVSAPSPELAAAGEAVAQRIGSAFPVGRAHYDGPLYGAKPVHRDPALQAWWDGLCNFERGDAVICVGQLLG
jgi:hypothetical protein